MVVINTSQLDRKNIKFNNTIEDFEYSFLGFFNHYLGKIKRNKHICVKRYK